MKGTDSFKKTIQDHLNGLAEKDPLFSETLKKPNKNIDDCINYIFTKVQKSGCNGFADEEIFGMAVHYYDEDDIKPGKAIKANVVVNRSVPATKDKAPKLEEKQAEKSTKEVSEKEPAPKINKKQESKIQITSLFE